MSSFILSLRSPASLFLALVVISALAGAKGPSALVPAGATYFVSKSAPDGGNGLSWETAWNELNKIDWALLVGGDTVLIDGGAGMTYSTSMVVRKSGANGNPITIRRATTAGRNGQVIIDGGRGKDLPFCGQTGYVLTPANLIGIDFNNQSWVVVDGMDWSGIVIRRHNQRGIQMRGSNNTVRNVEIYDNGEVRSSGNPDQEGVALSGANITFERVLIHDNGQDAFQSGGGVSNFRLRRSWLFNRRKHPNRPTEPFNDCTHSDGLQIFAGGNQHGVTIEDSIIGPGFNQGFILGDFNSSQGWMATIHDVTIRNSLLVGHHGGRYNANVLTKTPSDHLPTNYTIDRVTSVADDGAEFHNLNIQGSGHSVTNSIFVGAQNLTIDGSPRVSNNCRFQVRNSNISTTVADPRFVDPVFATPTLSDNFSGFDFTVRNTASCPNMGTSIVSVQALMGQSAPPPPPPQCHRATSGGGWVNFAFPAQTGIFTIQFDATPSISPLDSVMGLSSGAASAYTSLAVIPRFNPSGNIDARNGSGYRAASAIPYAAGATYHFRLEVDLPNHRYSAFVTPSGGSEQVVGLDFSFRTEQNAVARLDNFTIYVGSSSGSNEVCNFTVGP